MDIGSDILYYTFIPVIRRHEHCMLLYMRTAHTLLMGRNVVVVLTNHGHVMMMDNVVGFLWDL